YKVAFLIAFALLAFGLISKRIGALMHRRNLMAATAGLFLFSQFTIDSAEILLSERNFYGVIRVFDADLNVKRPTEPGGERVRQTFKMRYLGHGTTIHGLEILEPEEFKSKPVGYFSKVGPLGDIFSVAN